MRVSLVSRTLTVLMNLHESLYLYAEVQIAHGCHCRFALQNRYTVPIIRNALEE